MNTAKTLCAALAVCASLGAQAQAQAPAAGDLYGLNFDDNFVSTRSRAEVQAEAVQAMPYFKDFAPDGAAAMAASVLTREAVEAEAVNAVRTHTLDVGMGL